MPRSNPSANPAKRIADGKAAQGSGAGNPHPFGGGYERSGLGSDAVRAWELEPAESRCQNSGTKVPEFFSCLVLEK